MAMKASQIAHLLGHAATLCAALVAVALPWEGFQQIPGAPVTVAGRGPPAAAKSAAR